VASRLDAGDHAPVEVGEIAPVEAGVDEEVDACPTAVEKGGEVGSKPAGWRSASERASSRWLLRAGGWRPLRLDRC
jgi:hypothetical protein